MVMLTIRVNPFFFPAGPVVGRDRDPLRKSAVLPAPSLLARRVGFISDYLMSPVPAASQVHPVLEHIVIVVGLHDPKPLAPDDVIAQIEQATRLIQPILQD
jgi:hypothetical protein